MINRVLSALLLLFLSHISLVDAQAPTLNQGKNVPQKTEKAPSEEPTKVEIKPLARDEEISKRLEDIMIATGWFESPRVEVREGVVFLSGETTNNEFKDWAGKLAKNTQDVTAVVNNITIKEPPIWDFHTVIVSIFFQQLRSLVRSLPSFIMGLCILAIAFAIARLVTSAVRLLLRSRSYQAVLKEVIARGIGLIVFLFGLYLIFEMAGLTNIAFTVIGGTGLVGIILGIAFRDITENILASILLSIQNPFKNGDLIEIEGLTGYVQTLSMRVTTLMSLEGNHIQIPNATVYRSNLRNYTSNPNRREDFVIGIGFENVISTAQEVAFKVLSEHPAILKDPEPWVLVDSIGKSTVNLRIYFWLDGSKLSWLKVKSSVMRLTKRAYQSAGISMPDGEREVLFPEGVPIQLVESDKAKLIQAKPMASVEKKEIPPELPDTATQAESGLSSDAGEIKEQAEQARPPEEGKNLLDESKNP